MKIGIFSDTHLGFGNDERYIEAFDRFDEAIKVFAENKVDYILHAGDLFDHSVPDQEVWLKTFECFAKNNGGLREIKKTYKDREILVKVKGIPIIAIHGTHEHRGRDFANALEILEKSHSLVHVHAGYAILEKENNGETEKVYIHGMGGVPEKVAKKALEQYAPKPIEKATNVLLLHQSFKEFLPFDDESIATLSLSDLPKGFDLIIDGHLHWVNEQNISGKRFLLTGSTIYTQMKSLESEKGKGIFLFDTLTKELEFVPFKIQRKLFYKKLKFNDARPEEIINVVEKELEEIFASEFELKPLVRLKLVGTIARGFSQKDIRLVIPTEKAIFSITKKFEVESFKKKIDDLKELQSQKKSVVELGINLLENKVQEASLVDFDTRRIFSLLCENEVDKAEQILLKIKE